MSEPSAKLWLVQVDSDLLAAKRVWDVADERSFCQVVSKYQQAVEKSVKAVFAAMKESGVVLPPLGYDHDLTKLLSVLAVLPRAAGASLQQHIDGLLTRYHRVEIFAISLLAPKKPDKLKGELHRLNSEYPFEAAPNVWTAPAVAGTFSKSQVERFRTLAYYLYQGACRIVSSLRL